LKGHALKRFPKDPHPKLYLAARNIGSNGGNTGIQWSQPDLFFVNANAITSITADVTVRSASETNCPLNPAQYGA